MDKARFEAITAAYGAEPRRWPAAERAAAEAYAAREGVDLSGARALDALLDAAPAPAPANDLLAARILAARRKPTMRLNPAWALAACMIGGVLIGYGVGARAPTTENIDLDAMIVASFESPGEWGGGGL